MMITNLIRTIELLVHLNSDSEFCSFVKGCDVSTFYYLE